MCLLILFLVVISGEPKYHVKIEMLQNIGFKFQIAVPKDNHFVALLFYTQVQ